MRIDVTIDDELMTSALKLGGYRTKRSAIEAGLQLLVQIKGQEKLRQLKGRIEWEGDLDEMRTD